MEQGVPRDLLLQPLPAGGVRALLHNVSHGASASALSPLLQEIIQGMEHIPALPVPATHATMMDGQDVIAGSPEDGAVDDITLPNQMSDHLIAAMERNDVATVRRLIEAGEDANGIDLEFEMSPLQWAVQYGHVDLVRVMLDRGADIEQWATEGESPLMFAASAGDHTMVQLLLERGADATYRTDKGWDAVDFAAMHGHEGLAALLREEQCRHLRWAVREGELAVVRDLLDHGADVEERYDEGQSPLMVAAFHGHLDIVRLLLERGADATYRADNGWDAVAFAELEGHDDVEALLQEAQDRHQQTPRA